MYVSSVMNCNAALVDYTNVMQAVIFSIWTISYLKEIKFKGDFLLDQCRFAHLVDCGSNLRTDKHKQGLNERFIDTKL